MTKNESIAAPSALGTPRSTHSTNEVPKLYAKVDWNITDNHFLELTYLGEKNETDGVFYDYDFDTATTGALQPTIPVANHQKNQFAIAKYTGYLTDSLTFSATYGRGKLEKLITPDIVPGLAFIQSPTNQNPAITGGNPRTNNQGGVRGTDAVDETTGLRADLEWVVGDHTLTVGIDNIKFEADNEGQEQFVDNWIYARSTAANIVGGVVGSAVSPTNPNGYYVQKLVFRTAAGMSLEQKAWYIEDRWQVTDNLLLAPQDYTRFDIVAPTDARLPGGGGYTLHGFYDVVPTKFGQQRNLNALSDDYGDQFENWNGIDITVDARPASGLSFQGGLSTGKTMEDKCDIVSKLPEMNNIGVLGGAPNTTTTLPASWRAAEFCHRESPFLTQFKAYGVYTVPKIDVQVSGSFRSIPGVTQQNPPTNDVNVGFVASNAFLATNSTLGRPLAGTAPNVTLQLLETYSKYLDRRNELDLRFGKVLRLRNGARAIVSMDLYNALNSDAVVGVNQAFATYLVPTEILNARVAKFTVNFDF